MLLNKLLKIQKPEPSAKGKSSKQRRRIEIQWELTCAVWLTSYVLVP